MSDSFGFTVKRVTERLDAGGRSVMPLDPPAQRFPLDPPTWSVFLPHQCGTWEITAEDDWVPHDEAVRGLERFIDEAQQALAALREGLEIGDCD